VPEISYAAFNLRQIPQISIVGAGADDPTTPHREILHNPSSSGRIAQHLQAVGGPDVVRPRAQRPVSSRCPSIDDMALAHQALLCFDFPWYRYLKSHVSNFS
jgi:hypothetical protein